MEMQDINNKSSKFKKMIIKEKKWKKQIENFIDHNIVQTIMTIVTVFALFGDDIRQIVLNKNGDEVFYILYIITMVLFTIEIVLASIVKDKYLFSFFFWLDLISTLSILFDIGYFTNLFIDSSGSISATNPVTLTRAARATRIGTKAGRIIRIIRLIRIVKLYQAAENLKKKKLQQLLKKKNKSDNDDIKDQEEYNIEEIEQDDDSYEGKKFDINNIKESNVSKILSELITKKVIIIVLCLMVSIPILTVEIYYSTYTFYNSGLENIYYFSTNSNIQNSNFNLAWNTYIEESNIQRTIQFPLNDLQINIGKNLPDGKLENIYKNMHGSPNDILRKSDINTYTISRVRDGHTITVTSNFNNKPRNDIQAYLSIGRTIFICIILAGSAWLFSRDSEELVLKPIDDMLVKINNIAENPVEAVKIEEEKAHIWAELEKTDKWASEEKAEKENYETGLLENTIVKIGALLALGFGEAGSDIIAQNMQNNGEVDPMIPGKKVIAIFGFCDIRNFTDATEVLQEEVMIFVNEIANIVHSKIDDMLGAANKNIGDAFLLVWKFEKEDIVDEGNDNIHIKKNFQTQAVAEYSIYSFVSIISEINKSKVLEKYRKNKKLSERIKVDKYKVQMGFGLHYGWAIEGAIGSEYKIDASYLSPNVNMAARLEAATKQFGVPMLISGSLIELVSNKFKEYLRLIDRVTVVGSEQPIDLYTVDLDYDLLSINKEQKEELKGLKKKEYKFFKRQKKIKNKKLIKESKRNCLYEIERDKDFELMRKNFTKEFYSEWNKGFDLYIKGDWESAINYFTKTLDLVEGKRDGPSNTLIQILKRYNNKAPEDWKGYRKLTEK